MLLKPIICILAILVLATLACAGPGQVTYIPSTVASKTISPTNNPTAGFHPFTIDIEYAIPGLGQAYATTGISGAKPQPIYGMWGLIEPHPGQYNWKPLDDLVIEYQKAGFRDIQLLITAESPWASKDPPALLHPGDTFPKDEYLDDYAGFVKGFVERYDGDGVDDAPGLIYPIHEYGIEREFTGFWPGTAEEYVRLLRIAYSAIHQADSSASVLLVALFVGDVFDGSPTEAEIQKRLIQPQSFRKSYSEIKTILAACDAYDIVDFHSLGNYTEIPLTAAWIRNELASCGSQKPIWIGDAFSMSPLVSFNGRPFSPATASTRQQVIDTLKTITDSTSPDYASNLAWLQAEMARGLVQKIVVSAGEGIIGINIGNLEDWKTGIPAVDAAAVPSLGTSLFMGMMDTSVTSRSTGPQLPNYRSPGQTRPAFFALKLVNEKIHGFTSVNKLEVGSGVWAYRFETPGGLVLVLWYDDGKLYLPGQQLPSIMLSLPFASANALLTWTPTQEGQAVPKTAVLSTIDGKLSFTLDKTPVFIQVEE